MTQRHHRPLTPGDRFFEAIESDEDPTRLYWYDESNQRHELKDAFPGIRTF